MRDVKGNKKDFYKHTRDKRKTRGNVGLLLNGERALVMQSVEGTECLLHLSLH